MKIALILVEKQQSLQSARSEQGRSPKIKQMELIKRTSLHYQAENSDKVYEVDLCQNTEGRYLVNFRYGRRGRNLKEGTKTARAIPLNRAEKIFDKLVADKIKKGYQDVTELGSAATSLPSETPQISLKKGSREQAIVDRLAEKNSAGWSLDRVIWRAGELAVKGATPHLLKLITPDNPLRNYGIAWSLGRCGDPQAIPALKALVAEQSTPEHVQRIAWDAWFKLATETEQEELRSQKIAKLPPVLKELAQTGSAENFAVALTTYLGSNDLAGQDYQKFAVLDTIYQIDNEYVRPALLQILRTAPFQPSYFKRLRHIFKLAEFRLDAEVFGILAHRFELKPGNFWNPRRWQWDREQRRSIRSKDGYLTEELRKPNSTKAFGKETKQYFQKRIWRSLKTLAEDNNSSYVDLAAALLVAFRDQDAVAPEKIVNYRYNWSTRSYLTTEYNFDAYAKYLAFNHILYQNSPRYQQGYQKWRCQENYKPGDPIPKVREEAFPQLWDQKPEVLIDLLTASECLPVHQFAIKVLKANQAYCDRLEIPTLIALVKSKYEITAEFGFAYLKKLYDPRSPNLDLLLAVANCIFPAARTQAYQWIEEQREFILAANNSESSEFVMGLLTSDRSETRSFARKWLSSSVIENQTAQILIDKIITTLLAFKEDQGALAEEIGETISLSFSSQLKTLDLKVILKLLAHPLGEIQTWGAKILLNHQTPATELPPDLIESLLSSAVDSVRAIGIQIFGQLPDERLMSDRILLIAMAVNSSAEIRQAIRPVIRRLGETQPDFTQSIGIDLIDLLAEPERHEGVHKDLVAILNADIPNWQPLVTTDKIVALTNGRSSVAQEFGGRLLQAKSDLLWQEFSSGELVKFANHEILAIRQAAWQMFELKLDTIRHDDDQMLVAVKLLEAKWQDSQDFAQTLFAKLEQQDWTPRVMIGVCDSTKPEVRRFGRDLVMSNFSETYGQEYLVKFSEHPSKDMQLFATNYLETYALDNAQRLEELTPYFITVLSGVNKGGIAKKRIFNFLSQEATKSEAAAQIIGKILTRQSATVAIADKAAAIQIMVKIKRQYPGIELPIRVKEVSEVRS